jgi:hypothetical protein
MQEQVAINTVQSLFTFLGLALTSFIGYLVHRYDNDSKQRSQKQAAEMSTAREAIITENRDNHRKIDHIISTQLRFWMLMTARQAKTTNDPGDNAAAIDAARAYSEWQEGHAQNTRDFPKIGG